jgi:iron complex outermembrane receptor protein
MNLQRASLLGLVLLFRIPLLAQQDCVLTLSGTVSSTTGEPLPGATVVLADGTASTVTDIHGHYRLNKLCAKTYKARVQYVGFITFEQEVLLKENTTLDFKLDAEVAQLDEVVIRAHQAHTEHVHNATSLNTKQLTEAAGKTLGETLKEIPGVNTIQAGPGIFKPVIHGVHSQRILILNYGIRQEGQQWGAEHAPEIDPFIASNMVVIKDASAIKYGTDALGGVIVVNPPELPEMAGFGGKITSVAQTNGRAGTLSGYIEGGIKNHDGFGWRVQGTAKRAGDYHAPDYSLTNTGSSELNFSAAAGVHKENYGVEVFFSRFSTDLGILKGTSLSNVQDLLTAMENEPPQYTSEFSYSIGEPRQHVSHNLLKVNAHTEQANGEWRLQYGYQNNTRQEFDLRRGSLKKIPALDLLLQTHTLETEWEQENANGRTLCIGFTSMAQENANIPGTQRIPFIPNFVNYSGGAFGVAQKILGKWKLDAGLRYDYRFYKVKGFDYKNTYYEDELSFSNISGTVGATANLKRDRLDLNLSTAWRPPHVAELYSVGAHQSAAGIEYGLLLNPETNEVRSINDLDFKNEQALKGIATYTINRKKIQVTVSAFANRISNYIYLKPSGITENIRGAYPYFRYTQTDVLFTGLDAAITYSVSQELKLIHTTSLIRAYNQGNTGEMPFIAPNRFDWSLRWERPTPSGNHFFIETKVRLVAKQKNGPRVITPRQFVEADDQGIDLLQNDTRNFDFAAAPDGYLLLNGAAGYSLKMADSRLDFRFSVENGLNQSYREYTNRFRYFADDLGRNFILSVQYQF